MKTAALSQNPIREPFTDLFTFNDGPATDGQAHLFSDKPGVFSAINATDTRVEKTPGKPMAKYFLDVANELLKQNPLGTDINMEFLVLSIRVYTSLFFQSILNGSTIPRQARTERGIKFSSPKASYSFIN